MDEVFGSENFVSQIVFRKKLMPLGGKTLERMHDHILWYSKSAESLKYRGLYVPTVPDPTGRWTGVAEQDGTLRRLKPEERKNLAGLSGQGLRLFGTVSQWAPSYSEATTYEFDFQGSTYKPSPGQSWVTTQEKMIALGEAGRLFVEGAYPRFVSFHDDFPYRKLTNPWHDTAPASEATYVVQTNPRVIERCVLMSTDPGDIVLDPTCGSGTTAFVAEQWGRRWITADTSRVALTLARQRLMGARYPWYLLADSAEGRAKESLLAPSVPQRAAPSQDIRYGFVYERVQKITLKSIANNPDLRPGLSPAEVDAAIKRHAEFELLYDRPFQDTAKVRVAGPFTVESLSPHRSVSLGDAPESLSEIDAAKDAKAPTFEQSILENLAKAGVQNGKRAEKLKFEAFETYAGQYIQAIGQQIPDDKHASPSRIGIAIGPQYGTVSAKYVKDAAREAIRAGDVALLCVLGFAFDPQVTNVTEEDGFTIEATDEGFAQIEGARTVGRLPVLMVRMNADLLMGEELKKTGSGNLFTVFGEPDIDLRFTDEGYIVDLKGVDIYDPTTGEVRSSDTGQIALWMIDTDYNEESFFVRHCYFTGGNDPYKRLRTALKADIDAEAWESLYQTVSQPFPKPSTGKIAVKVINDYGDEVMKVFEVD